MTDIPINDINNPRDVFLKAIEEEKEFLAHFCDEKGYGVCGKANMPHSGVLTDAVTSYWKPHYNEVEDLAVICESCKEKFEVIEKELLEKERIEQEEFDKE